MPKNYDLLALDLDGTLLGPDGRVSPANRQAVDRARDEGLEIVGTRSPFPPADTLSGRASSLRSAAEAELPVQHSRATAATMCVAMPTGPGYGRPARWRAHQGADRSRK